MHDLLRLLFLPAAESVRATTWRPSADVYRSHDSWLVKFDLAGVGPEDIEVLIQGAELTVRGTRRDCTVEEGCCHYLMEIAYSHFERSITLPFDLGGARVTTEHRDGMLLVRIHREADA